LKQYITIGGRKHEIGLSTDGNINNYLQILLGRKEIKFNSIELIELFLPDQTENKTENVVKKYKGCLTTQGDIES
jgi:hypothetical protein